MTGKKQSWSSRNSDNYKLSRKL